MKLKSIILEIMIIIIFSILGFMYLKGTYTNKSLQFNIDSLNNEVIHYQQHIDLLYTKLNDNNIELNNAKSHIQLLDDSILLLNNQTKNIKRKYDKLYIDINLFSDDELINYFNENL